MLSIVPCYDYVISIASMGACPYKWDQRIKASKGSGKGSARDPKWNQSGIKVDTTTSSMSATEIQIMFPEAYREIYRQGFRDFVAFRNARERGLSRDEAYYQATGNNVATKQENLP
jgi:hypothetical protein